MPNRLRRLTLEPLPESADETGLPDTGVPRDRHQMRLSPLHRAPVSRLQEVKLPLPPDERAPEASDAPGPRRRERPNEPPARDAVRFARGRDGCMLAELE